MSTKTEITPDDQTATTDRVVLAIGGSSSGSGAARWAALEAARLGVPLQIVGVAVTPDIPDPMIPPNAYGAEGLEQAVRKDIEAVAERLRDDVDVLPVIVSTGRPLSALLAQVDERTQVLVLGHREMHAPQRVLGGSTSIAVAGRSAVPVVVVPDGWDPSAHTTEPVVVGVDLHATENGHHDGEPDVLRQAFERARAHEVPLVAVHAWEIPALLSWSPSDITGFRTRVEAAMDEVLSPWCDEFSDIEISRYAVAERPTDAMEDASKSAQLTVVGRHSRAHRHGGFHLGSTARAVLHHTDAPVLVVPTVHEDGSHTRRVRARRHVGPDVLRR